MPSLDSQSYTWPGSTINTSSDTDKIAPDPKTGKRPGILDWEGMGADVSRHPDKPGHDPKNCGIASSPFRGKMPSSGKVPRVPPVVTGHPQGGALRNPLTSGRAEDKASPVPSKKESFFLPCKWSMIGLPRTGPSGDTATVGGSEGPAGWEVNRARPNTPSRR